ncbi:MAG: cupredoxin domain-containing protein [Candidatus Pacebacteria bacterium]|nr:cupredoxin domain-containing protein [Candidatus Paceibacterota bacterium]
MKKSYIIIVLVVVLGIIFFISKNNKLQAPEEVNEGGITNQVPAGGEENKNVEEMIVVGEVREFTIEGSNFAFVPSSITVNKGDKVKITFKNTQGFHDFVVDEFGAATKQGQAPFDEVIEFTADKAGSFEYYCSVGTHRQMGMKGTLIVK